MASRHRLVDPNHLRNVLEQQVELLIELLDQLDGDPDLENDPLDHGEKENHDGRIPIYGVDQTADIVAIAQEGPGPRRERALSALERAQLAHLVRGAAGGRGA